MKDELTPRKKRDPYISQVGYTRIGKAKRRETEGQLVVVSGAASNKRGLSLIPQQTRALCKNEIHELITTDEVDAGPDKTVDSIAVIGFFEVSQGGVVGEGDPVSINDKEIGKIAGFDETHFPNHYNVVVRSSKKFSGLESDSHIGDKLRIGSQS